MDQTYRLFDRMDTWRQFPNYQLERRADLFFSLYLAEALEEKLGYAINPRLIPEFPVQIKTIYPGIPINKSYKIDYVVLSAASDQVIFVELKTERSSRRPEQDRYLMKAQEAGFENLLSGLLEIFRKTESKRKYYYLLKYLESLELLIIPEQVKQIMKRTSFQGLNEASNLIQIRAPVSKPEIVYVQPKGSGPGIISFSEFARVVRRHDDPISQRFAQSLVEWENMQAGMNADGSIF